MSTVDRKVIEVAGVIGDVHAEDKLLERAITMLREHGVDRLLCTGDTADGVGDVDRCCEILRDEQITVVSGNHDQWLLKGWMRNLREATKPDEISEESRTYLSGLPGTFEFQTEGGLVLLCHGIGENDMAGVKPDDYGYAIESNVDLQKLIGERRYKYVINGHTHRKMVRKYGGMTVINAGTLKGEQDPGFLTIDFVRRVAQFFEFSCEGDVMEAERIMLS